MATVTPNFGWDVPQSTDLVKDGATAIAALGNDIDTSLVDLKGGTTGQVLSKASNTDMDFTWSSVDPLTILDAKGDLITATAADTPARLAVGTNGQVLKANSATATGLEWGSASASFTTASAYTSGLESTSSATYTDLATVTSVTLTTGTKALVIASAQLEAYSTVATYCSFAVSGSTTIAASDEAAFWNYSSSGDDKSRGYVVRLVTGLTAGSNTFTIKFRVGSASTRDIQNRSIQVMDLGS